MEIRIIEHGSPEYAEMVELRNEVLRKPLLLHYTEEYLENEKDTTLIACFKKERLVGCCLLRVISEEVIQLQQMAVATGLQGKGIGKKLIEFAEETAINRGFYKLFMHARKSAVGFYKKLGYEVLGDEFEEVTIPHFMMRKDFHHS